MTKCNDLVNVWGGGLEKKINVKFKEMIVAVTFCKVNQIPQIKHFY